MGDFPTELLRQQLGEGLVALGLDTAVGEAARDGLLDYLAQLQRWNRSHNLTAIRDPHAMVAQQDRKSVV